MFIQRRDAKRRTPVLASQARLFSMLALDLIRAHARQSDMTLQTFFELPEYERLLIGAYACGFVCDDYGPVEMFEKMTAWPRDYLADCGFARVRHFTHTLLRAERWSDGYSSPIRESIGTGALQLIADRLSSDQRLMQPEVIEEEAAPVN